MGTKDIDKAKKIGTGTLGAILAGTIVAIAKAAKNSEEEEETRKQKQKAKDELSEKIRICNEIEQKINTQLEKYTKYGILSEAWNSNEIAALKSKREEIRQQRNNLQAKLNKL